ncbi:MAG: hypothetical protein QOI66_2639 [Myxococcales bacterium]|nr:hypothetical protein [Myxococcales bacterium]
MQTDLKKQRRSVYVRNLFIVSALIFLGCIVKEAKNNPPPLIQQVPTTPNYVVGTFEGTFSLDRTRVVAEEGVTALVVSRLDQRGKPEWMRSFDRLPKGYAVVHSVLPGGGVAVLGVVTSGSVKFDKPEQIITGAEHRHVLFLAVVSANGRVTSVAPIVTAVFLKSPQIDHEGGNIFISVPYEGEADIQGARQPRGDGYSRLKFGLTRDLKVINPMIIKASLDADPASAKQRQAATSQGPGLRMASMTMAGSTCNVCSFEPVVGEAACMTCVATLSPKAPWCFVTSWDRPCMDEALLRCFSGNGITIACNCPHDTCTQGMLLNPQCDHSTCVNGIDAKDSYCGTSGWDGTCVWENFPICGKACS